MMLTLFNLRILRGRFWLRLNCQHYLFSMLALMLALIAGFANTAAQAAQSYASCTGFIDTLPAVISTQGTWCLRQNLSTAQTNGSAITIAVDNVTVDCNDFQISGSGGDISDNFARGVSANNKLNATVRNCHISSFFYGVQFLGTDSRGHVVEDNRINKNIITGIFLVGNGSVVRRNLVSNTGPNPGYPGTSGIITGMSINGSVDVLDNTISGVTAPPTFTLAGIYLGIANDAQIARNQIRGLVNAGGSGNVFGIYAFASERTTLRNNNLVSSEGGNTSVGVRCSINSAIPAKNVTINNTVKGFKNGMPNCILKGLNVIQP